MRIAGPGRTLAALGVLALAAGCAGSGSPSSAGSGTTSASPSASPSPGATATLPTPHPEDTAHPDPTMFDARITNPWMPWTPGTRWVFLGHSLDGVEHEVVTVTDRTKVVEGVTTTVVHDEVRGSGGRLLEDTDDWYAQDYTGNVWYFGEDTKDYSGGAVDTSGSWEAGVDGAKPGIVMLADPRAGKTYRQEYKPGSAEDQATVLGTNASTTVPIGHLTGLLETRDFTRLEPRGDEHKLYAKGIGVVAEASVHGPDRSKLVRMKPKPRGLVE